MFTKTGYVVMGEMAILDVGLRVNEREKLKLETVISRNSMHVEAMHPSKLCTRLCFHTSKYLLQLRMKAYFHVARTRPDEQEPDPTNKNPT